VNQGQIREDERVFRMQTHGSDRTWTLHTASIAWNNYRQKWIMVGLEIGGESSYLGEVYLLEADQLVGPWSPGVKIVTHEQTSFYNPRLHPMLTQLGGRIIFFEGTFTHAFARGAKPLPRYNYNQIMYRVDLQSLGSENSQ
jgi:hypothetical protein